jgi:hypothetical protein
LQRAFADQFLDIARRIGRALGQGAHFTGNHGKALARVPGAPPRPRR